MSFSKENLNTAFKSLRKAGLMARQNFMCCSNCAGTALANKAEKLVDAGKTPKGCVFYHHQDASALNPPTRWEIGKKRTLMIRYGNLDTTKYNEIGLPTVEIGKLVCKIFDECSVPYEWNGEPSSCIEVLISA